MTGMEGITSDAVPARRSSIGSGLKVWFARPTSKTLVMNLGILIALSVWLSFATSQFTTSQNITNVLGQVSFIGISACLVTPVMVAGGLDLSVGSIIAVAGVTAAKFVADAHWPLGWAFLMGALAGGVIGALNAFLIVGMRINPVITTLGTMYIGRGLANVVAGGSPVTGVPFSFNDLATSDVGPVPVPVAIFAVTALVMIFVERKTILGRWTVASGGNQEAARLSGIPINRTRVTLYILSGLAAGVAGILLNSRIATGDPNSGTGFEFDVIVAVVLGGTAITGGQGKIIGSIVGVLIVGVLNNGLNLLGVSTFYQYIVQGGVLIFAVGVDEVFRHTWRNILRRQRLERRHPSQARN
ncbi:ABC transporter permease [Actinoallomurus liliacearum]|uniref:ABC transporter permease n=1 Tax=Actinoallomurus liliacearum TaxID=1080073 RepID=A0ABP8TSW8_9ACTN